MREVGHAEFEEKGNKWCYGKLPRGVKWGRGGRRVPTIFLEIAR